MGRRNNSRRQFVSRFAALLSLPPLLSTVPANQLWIRKGGKGTLNDMERIKTLLTSKDRYRWVFTGDSITMGAKHTHGYRSYAEIFHERLQWELGRSFDIVINTGVSGHTSHHILSDFDWRVTQFRPMVVSLMIGTNDCAKPTISPSIFEDNLDSLISSIRDIGAIPILHTPNPIIIDKAEERKTLPEYIPRIWAVARKKKVILVNNYNHWMERIEKETPEIIFREWLNDPLHPNGKGHQEIAREMFKTLGIFDENAATCGGGYYEGDH